MDWTGDGTTLLVSYAQSPVVTWVGMANLRGCSVQGCDQKHFGKGFCRRHYENWKRTGDPVPRQRPGGLCEIEGCERPRVARRLCKPHYRRLTKYGDPLGSGVVGSARQDEMARFFAKVDKTEGCWLWTGGVSSHGYSHFWLDGRTVTGHWFAYDRLVGPVPAGLQLDHLCRVKRCVNPAHLEAVTAQVNTHRGVHAPEVAAARIARKGNYTKTHCKWGHEFTPENTYIHPTRGTRHCRVCAARRSQGR